eukprot:TRINITY_DN18584_c0_g1_i1.p1 TRINITY_DN18584_c0_g1~~TRINITY_DN18584_c0_g1_i1.p1  ORF type:complete len:291 (+),score=81.92 TRINITY_DN18584_c0_g1_i1:113-985(+)
MSGHRGSWAGGGGLAAVRRRISLQKETQQVVQAQRLSNAARSQNGHALSDTHNATLKLRPASAASSRPTATRKAASSKPAFDLAGLPQERWQEYNGIYDAALSDHFSRDVWQRGLKSNGLLAKKGHLLSRDALRREARWGKVVDGAVTQAEKNIQGGRGKMKYLRYKCMAKAQMVRTAHEKKVAQTQQHKQSAAKHLARSKLAAVKLPPRPATATQYRPISPGSIFAWKSVQQQVRADPPMALPFAQPARIPTPSVSETSSIFDDKESETTLYARSTLSPSLRSEPLGSP